MLFAFGISKDDDHFQVVEIGSLTVTISVSMLDVVVKREPIVLKDPDISKQVVFSVDVGTGLIPLTEGTITDDRADSVH